MYSLVETAHLLGGKSGERLPYSPGPFCALSGQDFAPSFPGLREKGDKYGLR